MRNIKIYVDDILVGEAERRSIKEPPSGPAAADRGDGMWWLNWASVLGCEVKGIDHQMAMADRWDIYRRPPWTRELPDREDAVGVDALMRVLFTMFVDMDRLEALRSRDERERAEAHDILAKGLAVVQQGQDGTLAP